MIVSGPDSRFLVNRSPFRSEAGANPTIGETMASELFENIFMSNTSELFENIFMSNTSGCLRTCECGRTYFDGYDGTVDWEDGELEDLQEGARLNPDTCIETDHSITTIEINGKEFVVGCSCKEVDKYENFINQHARQIAEYLNKTADEMEQEAKIIRVKQPS